MSSIDITEICNPIADVPVNDDINEKPSEQRIPQTGRDRSRRKYFVMLFIEIKNDKSRNNELPNDEEIF